MSESSVATTLPISSSALKVSPATELRASIRVTPLLLKEPEATPAISPSESSGEAGLDAISGSLDTPAPVLLGQVPPDTLQPPSRDRLPEPRPLLPPPDNLLQTVPVLPPPEPTVPSDAATPEGDTLFVREFEVVGNTVFSPEELATITNPYINRNLTFAELLQVRSAITQLYVDRGYINSGAYIPPQTPEDGVLRIEVVEGEIEQFNITGTRRLQTSYVRDRLRLSAGPPFNLNQLVERLRLLQLDPLIDNISAELASSPRPGSNILNVQVTEADPFNLQLFTNNGRSPAVGSWRRGVQLNQANLLGVGDVLSVGYTNTRGSNAADLLYTVPINPRNGTLSFSVGIADSSVIEEPFNALDIQSDSRYYELTYRQPLMQTPSEEFALSLTASRQESRSEFLEDVLGESIPFPVSGADSEGRTRLSIVQFAQDWTRRGSREVLAARSQFSLGLDAFDATVNESGPDGQFFSWRGQGQWVRLLAPDTLFLLRGEVQLADSDLVTLEQFGIGGQTTVRGYRQDNLLTDNGVLVSAEVRLPILRSRRLNGVLQIIPFIDLGTGWNASDPQPDPRTLLSTGLGLQWQMGNTLTARIDWGIPLVDVRQEGDTWQENGVYFSVVYSPF
ncbi:MAG: ShlB/FhaC/HecB family hemolysin secretion/activation protein [Oculatellaceae cyanobacterium bins.114]|nr:ShlB/FhaC/HecB family hemolysin secretion/activation protein [Oculatellaceae cyanobacterium bins.114]